MEIPGLIAVAAVLVVGVAAGMWRRSTDGRLRTVAAAGALPEEGVALAVDGPVAGSAGETVTVERIDPELLGALGVRAGEVTLLQFSSAFCAPCRAVRRVSAEVADMLDGVRHVEVDAESHLDAVRALNIWKTPTLLVVGPDGRVAKRATGVPGKPHLIAALADLLPSR